MKWNNTSFSLEQVRVPNVGQRLHELETSIKICKDLGNNKIVELKAVSCYKEQTPYQLWKITHNRKCERTPSCKTVEEKQFCNSPDKK